MQAIERVIWGPLTLMSSLYRGDRKNAPVPLSPEWASRLSALFTLARQAPLQRDDTCIYDPDLHRARRTARDGTVLAEALPLRGRGPNLKALVVRVGEGLLLASNADGTVDVPTEARVAGVTRVRDDGNRQPVPFSVVANGVSIDVADAGGSVSHYVIALER